MGNFFSLNKKKLPYMFLVIALIFLTLIVLLLVIVGIVNDDLPSIEGYVVIVAVTGIVVPVIILTIAYVAWLLEKKLAGQILRKPPFDQLQHIGFVKTYINQATSLHFTEEGLEKTLEGYTIRFISNRDKPKTASFLIFANHEGLSNENYKRLVREFKEQNVAFDFDGVIKSYSLKKPIVLTIEEIDQELKGLIEKLKKEGFQP